MLFSFVPCTVSAANVPTWNDTNEWAYGGKAYLDIAPGTDQYEMITNLLALYPSVDLRTLNLNGSVEAYVYISVANGTGSTYEVSVVTAALVEATADVSVEMAVPTKVNNITQPTQTTKVISVNADLEMKVYSKMNVTVEKSTLAIKSINATATTDVSVRFKAYNLPVEDITGTTEFRNFDISVTMTSGENISAVFTPALDIYKFPINVGEKWTVSSNVIVSGDIYGSAQTSGLPEDLVPVDNGNIDLEDLTDLFDGIDMKNGSFGPYPATIDAKMNCTAEEEITLPDGRAVTVYVINVNEHDGEPEFVLFYSPDLYFLTDMEVSPTVINELDTSEIPALSFIDLGINENMKMSYIAPNEAASGIEDISGNAVTTKSPATSSNNGDNGMLMIVLVVAVVAVVAIAAVMVLKRKK